MQKGNISLQVQFFPSYLMEPLPTWWSIFTFNNSLYRSNPSNFQFIQQKAGFTCSVLCDSTDLYCWTKRPVSISSETGRVCSSAEASLGAFPVCGGRSVWWKSDAVQRWCRRSAYSCLLSSSLSSEREKLQLCLYPPSRLVSDLSRAWIE